MKTGSRNMEAGSVGKSLLTFSSILTFLVMMIFSLLASGVQSQSVQPYDYSYTYGCVAKVQPPQYNGGILVNPEFNKELKGWNAIGSARLENAKSLDDNNYVIVSNILATESDGISQTLSLKKNRLYTVSAWLQASNGETSVQAKLVSRSGNQTAGWITAKSGCWTMLKGGFSGNVSGHADLRFESNSVGVEFWVDSVSVQPFTQQEWTSHQDQSVEKVRKTRVELEVVDETERGVANATVFIRQRRPHFPFGCAINNAIIDNPAYQKWFLKKGFRYSVFENELKWGEVEKIQGVENYTAPDAMLEFCKSNNITVRGHNILWDDMDYQAKWVKKLLREKEKLKEAAIKRVNSVVNRYKGEFIHWDVINENMHNSLFSNVTVNGIQVFKLVHQLDSSSILFLNEFKVIEVCSIHGSAQPWQYLQKIEQIRSGGYDGPLGIGLEGHFNTSIPNIPFIRASIDMLATTGLPIWITEFGVQPEYLVEYIEPLLRELHSHAAIEGIMLWGTYWPKDECFDKCLIDKDFNNFPAGDQVDKFMNEFINVADTIGMTDARGWFETLLFYGEYDMFVTLPNGSTTSMLFNLIPGRDTPTFKIWLNPPPPIPS